MGKRQHLGLNIRDALDKLKKFLLKLTKHNLLIFITTISAIFALQLFVYFDLLQNIKSRILDWLDYPLVVFLTTTQTRHFLNLELGQLTESLMFYPHTNTMFFSDTFITQGLLNLPFYAITKNVILSFNLTFFLTLLLNTISANYLCKQRFQGVSRGVGTLLLSLSPFLILNLGHFQLLSIWPLYFGLSYVFKKKQQLKDFVWLGVWLTILFYASIYLFLLGSFLIALWFFIKFFQNKLQQKLIAKEALIALVITLLGTGWGIYNYWQTKLQYNMTYQYSEYVQYAADPADYLSLGFSLLILAVIGIRSVIKEESFKSLNLLFLFSIPIGFIFSLGPRLTWFGHYTALRLPYDLVVKLVPLVAPLRATERWSLWFYLGVIYFATLGFKKLWKQNRKWLASLLVIVFFIETVPFNLKTTPKDYYPSIYEPIAERCQNEDVVLLETPLSLDQAYYLGGQRAEYWSEIVFAITFHQCHTINGYSGFFPPELTIQNLIDNSQQNVTALDLYDRKLYLITIKNNY